MRVLKVNVVTQQIEEVEYNGNFKEIYNIIGNGCNTFECPVTLDNEDTFYCDEEGLFHDNIGGWKMKNFAYPIVGNSVLIGTNLNNGESVDAVTTKEELEKMIIWVDKQTAQKHIDKFN